MADDKTTKMPEQPVTDTGPGKETSARAGESVYSPGGRKKDGTAGKEPAGVRL